MIEINLLPGGAKKRKSRGGSAGGPDFRAALAAIGSQVTDPYLISAVGSLVIAGALIGGLFVLQQKRETEMLAAEEVAVADSVRYANFMKQRRRATATRDTVLRQINVIRVIDGDRYLWPHILNEVSSALPQYTWLTSLAHTGTPQGTSTPLVIGNGAPDPAKKAASRKGGKASDVATIDTSIVRDSVSISIEGQTVDIEAITRFMRQLEASPFISDVQLGKSQLTIERGKEVTTFSLQASYTRVDSGSVITRVPLTASVIPTAGN